MKRNKKSIYLDYASGIKPNPGAIHKLGVKIRGEIETARRVIGNILGAGPDEIIFTGSGTEGNNLAILGTIAGACENSYSCALPGVPGGTLGDKNFRRLPHVVTTNIEHPSVLEVAKIFDTTFVPVEPNGIVDPEKIKKAIRSNTVLISVHYANNEIGTIQPIREIAKIVRAKRKEYGAKTPYLHIDACQAVHYLPLNVEKLGVDLMTLSGTKISEPGIGILYKRRGVEISPIMRGGGQESGLRPGTENTGAILRLAAVFLLAEKKKEKEVERLTKLRDYFFKKITPLLDKERGWGEVIINGDLINRLPNNVNISVSGIESELLVLELDARGIAVSSKSACKSGEVGESYVIKALRPKANATEGSIRFSLGPSTKKADIDYVIASLKAILEKLKKWYN